MRVSLLSLLILTVATPLNAGLVFEIETRHLDYSPPRNEVATIYAEGVALKMESTENQRAREDTMIFRGDRREMIVVDHGRQSYMVIDKQFVSGMMGQLQQMAGQVQGMLDSVPPEQRAMIEQMTKNRPQQNMQLARPQIEVRGTGVRDTVYGYPCVLFEVLSDGRKVRDVWVTDWNNIKGSRNLATTFDSMSDFFQELVSALPQQAQMPVNENAFATIRQMRGFPVASREYRADGSVESESALRSARYRQINLTEFQPPATYNRDSMLGGDSSFGRPPSSAGRYPPVRR